MRKFSNKIVTRNNFRSKETYLWKLKFEQGQIRIEHYDSSQICEIEFKLSGDELNEQKVEKIE